MDKVKIARGVVTLVVNSSVHTTISNTLTTFQNPVTKWQKVKSVVGPFIVAAMVADAAEGYAGRKFDGYVHDLSHWEYDFSFTKKPKDEKGTPEADEVVVEHSAPTQ